MPRKKVEQAKTRKAKVVFEAEAQMRKIQEAAERRAKELQSQIEEAERLENEAIEEEKRIFEKTESDINQMTNDAGYFCGVILSREDVLAIVDLMIQTKQNVKIPFKLYPLDDATTPPDNHQNNEPKPDPEPVPIAPDNYQNVTDTDTDTDPDNPKQSRKKPQ